MALFKSWQLRLSLLAVLLSAWAEVPSARGQVAVPVPGGVQFGRDSTPSLLYFRAIEQMYKGDFRDAQRTFQREVRGAIKIGSTRWVDSIAYHAMLGEVLYRQGNLEAALEQFDQACLIFLENPNWMIRVNFFREPRVDANRLRQPLPWGKSSRSFTLGDFPSQEAMLIGDSMLEQQNTVQRGGTLRTQQQWRINVIEIVRTTALAIRRRNELLGPLAAEDSIGRELVTALSRNITIPNHWSKAWGDVLLGVAQVGADSDAQAEKYLQRSLLARGKFDHPLTCVALLELGKLRLAKGDLAAALDYFAEASYSGFYYEDIGIIDESFRWATIAHLGSSPAAVNPLLEPAANWASRKRYDLLFARVSLSLAEEAMHLGDGKVAQTALRAGQSRLEDAAQGLLGNQALYLEAKLQYLQGRESAGKLMAQALGRQVAMSLHNLQLLLVNRRYDQQQLQARSVVGIYEKLLADPEPLDWVLWPFETLARLQTPHLLAFDRWFDALLARKDIGSALEVTDLAKRHRFHKSLAWGGRLAALRDTLETPEHLLSQEARGQRNELLLRFPQYGELQKTGEELQLELSNNWQPGIDSSQIESLNQTWRSWENNLSAREETLPLMALQRAAVDMQFPPVMPTAALQKSLQPGQAIVVFHQSPSSLVGFLLTAKDATNWQCAPNKRLSSLLSTFLRDLGNFDANHQVPVEDLASTGWQESGAALYEALFAGSSLDVSALEELILVPDGLVWYVPFSALPVRYENEVVPLIAKSRLRMAPTVGLAVGHTQPWRRVQRTAIVGEEVLPGESKEEKAEALETLREAAENPVEFLSSSPAPEPVVASMLEGLVMLDEVELNPSQPLDWSPVSVRRSSKQSSLGHWLTLPQFGPQRILLPAARTIAERGGKASRRRGDDGLPGNELFLASCSLMSTGAQTILLSSWRVGGDATLELTREFLQELPYTNAAAAWQRSVQLARELPLIAELQPRVKVDRRETNELTAEHPFFWAGYLLFDSGALAPGEEAAKAKGEPVAQAQPAK